MFTEQFKQTWKLEVYLKPLKIKHTDAVMKKH